MIKTVYISQHIGGGFSSIRCKGNGVFLVEGNVLVVNDTTFPKPTVTTVFSL